MNRQDSSIFSQIIERMQKVKKTDWLALALAGAILLIVALPEDTEESKTQWGGSSALSDIQTKTSEGLGAQDTSQSERLYESSAKKYVEELEEKLEAVLTQMDGVGEVQVMITISDYGENVVEKDVSQRGTSVTEILDGNSTKTSVEQEMNEATVHVEDENGTYPYIEKEILPTIEGIVVVAEGGGNATVVSNISKAAMALFPIEAHKIIVVKMSDKGDSP